MQEKNKRFSFDDYGFLSVQIDEIRLQQKRQHKQFFDEFEKINYHCEQLKFSLLSSNIDDKQLLIVLSLVNILDTAQGAIILMQYQNYHPTGTLIRTLYESLAKVYCLCKYEKFSQIYPLTEILEQIEWAKKAEKGLVSHISTEQGAKQKEALINQLPHYKELIFEFLDILKIPKKEPPTNEQLRKYAEQIFSAKNLFRLAGLEDFFEFIYAYYCSFTHVSLKTLDKYLVLDENKVPKKISRLNYPFLLDSGIGFMQIALIESFIITCDTYKLTRKKEYKQLVHAKKRYQSRIQKEISESGKQPRYFKNSHNFKK